MSVTSVHTCDDRKCTDGITGCAGCNGHGVVNPKGKAYRDAKNIPAWAVVHDVCHGTGLVVCGQLKRRLTAVERKTLGMPVKSRKAAEAVEEAA